MTEQPLEEGTPSVTKIITLDPDGDLTLVVGDPLIDPHRFLVARKTLVLASSVWRAMLQGPFSESGAREIPLPEDDPEAFQIILNILHVKLHLVPADLEFPCLLKLADTIDKYDLLSVVAPFAKQWLKLPLLSTHGKEEWIFIAWVFGAKETFTRLANHMVSTQTAQSIDGLESLRMPLNIVESIKTCRLEVLKDLLYFCRKRVSAPFWTDPSPPTSNRFSFGAAAAPPRQGHCSSVDSNDKTAESCGALMLGSLLFALEHNKLFPVPLHTTFSWSVDLLWTTMKNIPTSSMTASKSSASNGPTTVPAFNASTSNSWGQFGVAASTRSSTNGPFSMAATNNHTPSFGTAISSRPKVPGIISSHDSCSAKFWNTTDIDAVYRKALGANSPVLPAHERSMEEHAKKLGTWRVES